MYLIVGLGNPEEEYAYTRHNMGFDVMNELAKRNQIEISRTKYQALYGTGSIQGEKVMLIKPQTFMNLSGTSVKEFLEFYKLDPKDHLIVLYDDMDVEVGSIKIRKKGGPGSHNGMKSMVHELLTDEFTRIRIGIGRPLESEDRIEYVIGPLEEAKWKELKVGIDKAADAVEYAMQHGIDKTMNQFN